MSTLSSKAGLFAMQGAFLLFACCSAADTLPIEIKITDTAPYHVYPSGLPFELSVEISGKADTAVMYYWKDFRGKPLTRPEKLIPGKTSTIRSPASRTGYYELNIKPENTLQVVADRQPGEEKSYGFIIHPRLTSKRIPDPASPFGVVQADITDAYVPTWAKTLTWNTTGEEWWHQEMQKRNAAGIQELPIIAGKGWDSNDSTPIADKQLGKLKARIQAYFTASPTTQYWETGIEENLSDHYQQPYYWKNLESKLRVVREAADKVNPDIKLIYQIAGLDLQAVKAFSGSRASRLVDILSIHPYAWPDFPSPENWHDKFIQQVHQLLLANGLALPVWYTEAGVVQQGNAPGAFFGYPEENNPVTGLSPYHAVLYMIKLHVLALHAGIEKIFWYNYQDQDPEREYAENHFGLRDYWGYPKPVYAAYLQLHRTLTGKKADSFRKLSGDIFIYQFSDSKSRVLVAWTYPATSTGQTVPLSSLLQDYSPGQKIQVVNPVGQAVAIKGNTMPLSGEPVYIISEK